MGVWSQLREATMRFLCLRGVLVRDRPLPSSVDQAGDSLLYATGGFAWTYYQLTLTQRASGATDSPFLWRFGWVAGAGVEFPVMPHWTAKFEYLLTDYGVSSVTFPTSAQRSDSNFLLQEFRVGLNYQFDATSSDNGPLAALWPDSDRINFHGQTTFVEQAYPSFRSRTTDSEPISRLI
jgi:high affinity Mn2+ porin